LQHDDLVMMTF